jgi:hypothetical protein
MICCIYKRKKKLAFKKEFPKNKDKLLKMENLIVKVEDSLSSLEDEAENIHLFKRETVE